jgi:hypothetical protein
MGVEEAAAKHYGPLAARMLDCLSKAADGASARDVLDALGIMAAYTLTALSNQDKELVRRSTELFCVMLMEAVERSLSDPRDIRNQAPLGSG